MRDAYDAVVVGGGSAGCVLAARLSDNPGRSVLLLEAGPDYGPYKDGRWPDDILDGRRLPMASHDWGFAGGDGGASKNKLPTSSWRRPSCAVGCPHPGSSLCSKPPSWMPSTRSGYPFSRDSTGLGGDPERPGSPKTWSARSAGTPHSSTSIQYERGPNLRIQAETLVDRIVFEGTRPTAIIARTAEGPSCGVSSAGSRVEDAAPM